MATITLKINERTKAGKALKDLIDALAGKPQTGVEIIETGEKRLYDPEFVARIKKAAASKNRTEINPEDVWGSLGLRDR